MIDSRIGNAYTALDNPYWGESFGVHYLSNSQPMENYLGLVAESFQHWSSGPS